MMSLFSESFKNQNLKLTIYKALLQLLIISFPFGAMIFSLHLVYFTIYPYIVVLFSLFIFSFFFISQKKELSGSSKHEDELYRALRNKRLFYKISFLYFVLLFLYGLLLAFISGVKSYSIFDLRSLALFTVTIFIFYRSEQIIGWEKFKKMLGSIFALIFIAFTIIGIFEFLTGIHIQGSFTQKLLESPVSNEIYNPFFIYDNPNNFITYYIIIGITLFLLNDKIKSNFGLSVLILTLIFAFSSLNNSRFGELSSIVIFIETVTIHYRSIKYYIIKHYIPILIILIFTLCAFMFNPLYFGPLWQKSDRYIENSILLVQTDYPYKVIDNKSLDTCKNRDEIISAFKSYRSDVASKGSDAVRAKLIKNGLFLFTKSNGIGVGPGMYRYYHDIKQIPNNVALQNGPHNWAIELISQYGILGILYFLLFLYMTVVSLCSLKKAKEAAILFLFSTLIFFIMSNSPSAFGLLDINWIFTGIILLFFTNEILINDKIEHKKE